jgi:hypothetical protein
MHDQMTIGTFQCSVSMRVSFVLRSAEETLEMTMHLNDLKHRNDITTKQTACTFTPQCIPGNPTIACIFSPHTFPVTPQLHAFLVPNTFPVTPQLHAFLVPNTFPVTPQLHAFLVLNTSPVTPQLHAVSSLNTSPVTPQSHVLCLKIDPTTECNGINSIRLMRITNKKLIVTLISTTNKRLIS